MRIPRILVALGLALLGPAPAGAADARPTARVRSAGTDAAVPVCRGHLRRGPGYTVWQETRREAESWAAELEACTPPGQRQGP